ncbi:MAG: beta-lactamase family protein [Planctomycetes bacterium]|nr:beta-lactamase family protein [Planctomycetota bacterium]
MGRLLLAAIFGFTVVSQGLAQDKKIPVSGVANPDLAPFDEMMLVFLRDNQVPGASLAVAKDGRLVYARGFGYADEERTLGVQPTMRFRIASISKPITGAMILRLVELGLVKLDDHAFEYLQIALPAGADARLKKITLRHLLHHSAGFDRGKSFDPMFRPIVIAKDQNTQPPAKPIDIIRYMTKQKLDFDPGTRYAYSNFGYCVLGRVIENATGQSYEAAAQKHLFDPIGVKRTQLGRTLFAAKDEVHYFDAKDRKGLAVMGPSAGKLVPLPYGAWHLEAMDSHGGWISTAPDLVRFGSAFDDPQKCKILKPASIKTMFAPPSGVKGLGKDPNVSYGCGWNVRRVGDDKLNTWHMGALDGTATLLVRRHDGLTWAVLFNARRNAKGEYLGNLIDPLVHQAADRVKNWPRGQP